jgi:hypothetical protein
MLSGVLAPYVVAAITPNVSTIKSHSSSNRNIHLLKHFQRIQSEWRVVFLLTALVYLVGALVFAIFADCEEQKWSNSQCRRAAEDDQKVQEIECEPLKRI